MEGEKIKKVLFNEITAIVALVGLVVGFMNWVNNPVKQIEGSINELASSQALIQKDIQIINHNHLTHIERYLEEQQIINKEQDVLIREICENIVEIKTMLKSQ